MIHPLRIAKIKQAIGERAALQRNPGCGGKITARFNYQRDAWCPCDIESELVLSHSEASVSGLRLRIPQDRRASGIGRSPSTGSRKVIDNCVGGGEKRVRMSGIFGKAKNRRVALEVNANQVGAIGKGAVAKIGETFADDYIGEAGAASERSKGPTPGPDSIADIGDVIGDGNPSQP